YINANARCTRRQLVEALAPSPAAPAGEAVVGQTATATPAESAQPTPEQTVVIADLHWLVHQGHVIEFANGILETAKRPVPKPSRPEPAPAPAPAAPVPAAPPVSDPPHPESAPPTAEAPAAANAAPASEAPANVAPAVPTAEPPAEPSAAPVESPP